jgi:hypothetical protein
LATMGKLTPHRTIVAQVLGAILHLQRYWSEPRVEKQGMAHAERHSMSRSSKHLPA